jgi:hypothetical protein
MRRAADFFCAAYAEAAYAAYAEGGVEQRAARSEGSAFAFVTLADSGVHPNEDELRVRKGIEKNPKTGVPEDSVATRELLAVEIHSHVLHTRRDELHAEVRLVEILLDQDIFAVIRLD